jgi:anti-anti-sigma factor
MQRLGRESRHSREHTYLSREGDRVEVSQEDAAVVLSGRLDGRCSASVRAALHEYIDQHPDRDVVVDLTEVESIDVTMLNLLAAAALRVERTGRRVVLRGLSPSVRRVIAFGGWRRLFRVERDA